MNFAGGLLYDWLLTLAAKSKNASKNGPSYSKRSGTVVENGTDFVSFGSALKTFKYQNYGFAAGLVLQLG